jgi:hypothetical protein
LRYFQRIFGIMIGAFGMILQKEEPFFSCGYAVFLLKTNEPAAPSRDTAADRIKA